MPKKTIWVLNQTAGTPNSGWGERHYYFAKKWIAKGYKVGFLLHKFETEEQFKEYGKLKKYHHKWADIQSKIYLK